MVWGDRLEATRPWRGAGTLQSLILNTEYVRRVMLPRMALLALPSLTHLHSPSVQSDDTLQYIAQHLGDRLIFLRLTIDVPLPQPITLQFSALQSLYISISSTKHGVVHMSDCLYLLLRLSEPTVWDSRRKEDEGGDTRSGRRLLLLRQQLAAGVWCDDVKAVEDQRLERRWQHEMGVHVGDCS